MKLVRAGEFYFALVLARLVYKDGLKLLYSLLSEKTEMYGNQESVQICLKNSYNSYRLNITQQQLPPGISEDIASGQEKFIKMPDTILGMVILGN